ncbi:MAG: hypothetical protein WC512_06800, partial [Candidatus Omnitrophota bacterium]
MAAPSAFSGFKGPEFKESAQIQAGILAALKGIESLDVNALQELGVREFAETTVFGNRVQGNIYFNESSECKLKGGKVTIEKDSYVFRATTKNAAVYYCLISKKGSGSTYNVSVVPERVLAEAMEKGVVKFTHDSVSNENRDKIALYLEHEITTENNEAIDPWIARKMASGEYLIDNLTASAYPVLYQSARKKGLDGKFHSRLISRIRERMRKAGVIKADLVANSLLSKPLILIPYDEGELPNI